jgi:hypothetical protein
MLAWQILEEMIGLGSLKKAGTVDLEDSTAEELHVHWHLCADHRLVMLEGGMGGYGCNLPCFLCHLSLCWNNGHAHAPMHALVWLHR